MDMERLERVMERVYGRSSPPEGGVTQRETLTACIRACHCSLNIMSTIMARSRVCASMLRPALVLAERREVEMQTEYYLQYGDVFPSAKRRDAQTGTLRLLRDACLTLREEGDMYACAAGNAPEDRAKVWRLYEAQALTGEKLCRTLLDRALGKE